MRNGGITLLALGTSSCKDFILSAIRSLLNCPYSFFTQIKRQINQIKYSFNNQKKKNKIKQINDMTTMKSISRTEKNKNGEEKQLLQYSGSYSFSDAVRVGSLSSPCPHLLLRLRRRSSSAARRRGSTETLRLLHRSSLLKSRSLIVQHFAYFKSRVHPPKPVVGTYEHTIHS